MTGLDRAHQIQRKVLEELEFYEKQNGPILHFDIRSCLVLPTLVLFENHRGGSEEYYVVFKEHEEDGYWIGFDDDCDMYVMGYKMRDNGVDYHAHCEGQFVDAFYRL